MRLIHLLSLALLACSASCARAALPCTDATHSAAKTSTEASASNEAETETVAPRALDRVVIVSIDGLRPVDCARLPTLGTLAREGAFASSGALSVTPSVTYPAHTTIVTGTFPDRHGITTNAQYDPTPDGQNKDGWRWYRADVRVPTLYDIALDAGLRTAILNWPVTVGARATTILPEYWRTGTADDVKLARAMATPGLFDAVVARFPDFLSLYTPPRVKDAATIDLALTALETVSPHLMLMHIWQTDDAQHGFGPDSPEADAALRNADAEVARLLSALQKSPEWPRTLLVVVSDHGFARVDKVALPFVHLQKAGLSERVHMINSGSLALFYLLKPDDEGAAARTKGLFDELARHPEHGIGKVLDREALRGAHADREAFLGVEARQGFMFSRARTGEPASASTDHGSHGYVAERPEMRATLLFYGPRIAPASLEGARLVDVAPTIADLLGLTLSDVDGKTLALALRDAR